MLTDFIDKNMMINITERYTCLGKVNLHNFSLSWLRGLFMVKP